MTVTFNYNRNILKFHRLIEYFAIYDNLIINNCNIVLKYAVNSDCGSIESEVMNISITTTAIENTQGNATQIYKIIHNGQLLIIRDGNRYTLMGQTVKQK